MCPYHKAWTNLSKRYSTLTTNDIRLSVSMARRAIAHAYTHTNRDGSTQRNTTAHDMDTYGCGWWTPQHYARVMLARFIVEKRGIRIA